RKVPKRCLSPGNLLIAEADDACFPGHAQRLFDCLRTSAGELLLVSRQPCAEECVENILGNTCILAEFDCCGGEGDEASIPTGGLVQKGQVLMLIVFLGASKVVQLTELLGEVGGEPLILRSQRLDACRAD